MRYPSATDDMIAEDANIKELKKLYRNLGYVTAFVRWRCAHAPYAALERLVPKEGRILDLGCGYGLFSNFLALTSDRRMVKGIDICERKLKFASRGLHNVEFAYADAGLHRAEGEYGCIVAIHLLHHLPSYDAQAELARLCRGNLRESGRLLVMEIDTRPLLKFLFTQLVDNVAYFGDRFYYRKSADFKSLLEKEGFRDVSIYPAWQDSLLSHVIISGRKSA